MKNKRKNQPLLRFSPTAWAKLVFLRDRSPNEVGGFGITDPEDLLLVRDIALVKQKVTALSVSFEDESVADFFESQVDAGRKPEQFARLWVHTHPGSMADPSMTDIQTFERVFGRCQWAILFILDQSGGSYAGLRFNVGPGGEVEIPVRVEYGMEFEPTDFKAWQKEYQANVVEESLLKSHDKRKDTLNLHEMDVFGLSGTAPDPDEMIQELEMMPPSQRQAFIDELAVRSEFWDEQERGIFDEY